MFAAQCEHSDNLGIDVTSKSLAVGFAWMRMKASGQSFVTNCLRCLVGKLEHKLLHPISLTLHATRPDDILHFDYLHVGLAFTDLKYFFVLKDDLSSYLWLHPCRVANAEIASHFMSRWFTIFTAMHYEISDQGAHFKISTMEILASKNHVFHHFAVAYSPWVNVTVERCMRQIRKACISLLSEFQLEPQNWPNLLEIIMKALNTVPQSRNSTGQTPVKPCSHKLEKPGFRKIHFQ